VTAALPAEARGRPVEVWWQDEARVGQQGTLTRLWAARGSRPAAPKNGRYSSAYLFGAMCPARGVAAGLVLPAANQRAMSLHVADTGGIACRPYRAQDWCGGCAPKQGHSSGRTAFSQVSNTATAGTRSAGRSRPPRMRWPSWTAQAGTSAGPT
jgi:hypothetical protein